MYPGAVSQSRRLRILALIALVFTSLATLVCFWHPQRITNWTNYLALYSYNDLESTPSTCKDLPGAEDVFVLLKTGAHEAQEKVPAYLNTTLRCVPRFGFYSDLEQKVEGHTIYDALDEIRPSVREKYEEFNLYRILKEYQWQGRDDYHKASQAAPHQYKSKEDSPGWKLDKWKFLPLLEKAIQHDAKWYFFMETDTHVVFSNLLHWLNKHDANERLYFGGPAWFGDLVFAHGGAGFVLSRPAVVAAVEAVRAEPIRFERLVANECCGDSMLARVMKDVNITLVESWPMLQGETINSLDYTERHWCYPIISQHRMSVNGIASMWNFEQEWLSSPNVSSGTPIMHKDVFARFLQNTVQGNKVLLNWNNLSGDQTIKKGVTEEDEPDDDETVAHKSLMACEETCERKDNCVQYSYMPGECRLGNVIRLGSKADPDSDEGKRAISSGWMAERIQRFRDSMEPCKPQWILEK
ncbi:MAG: hypothetical protein M1831_004927 [Alyxoria varia]|nr:MAG: hypothetical protein M1831_004927 [Alyxoria varia]